MVGAALKTLGPLIVFAAGVLVLFALKWKAKWFVFLVAVALTVFLFASPLGATVAAWLSRSIFGMTGYTVRF
jgi:H+/gluconate symporter-like permease